MQQSPGTLAARRVTKSHGAHVVLDDVSLVVPPRARVGVVGPNGSGKTTLLRLLAGEDAPDAGAVGRSPATLRVGYLPQEPDVRPDETLLAYLARRTGVGRAAARMDALARELADGARPDRAADYTAAVDEYVALGGGDFETRARAVCGELALAPASLGRRLDSMSGGERARAALATILLSRFDVLLLDEPTNDLDFAGLELLERFLDRTPAALVVVSHDRALLDRVATRIVELVEGGDGIREWPGRWSEYEDARAAALRRHYEAYEQSIDERRRIEEQARRMQRWEEHGYGQGRKKKKTKDVKGTYERRLARVEVIEKPFEPWELRLELAPAARGPDVVARLAGAVVERGPLRLGPLDLELGRGERVSVAGANGSGKTTLVDALVGRLPLAAGTRALGAGVVVGELEQGRSAFAGDEPALPTFRRVTGLRTEDARTLLAKYGLGPDHLARPAASLSPGERTRAVLATFAARGANLLVLDEPTNHLDLPAIEQLEAALERYEGTLLVVSHDRRFLERVAPTRTVDVNEMTQFRSSPVTDSRTLRT
ncbi:MAG: ABC-F family ATP-binding cassette domain-containing protein [Thermoleophilia bacterium]|nr:ABC-F family ATP-binding cassette domain-containing protein [Thermoleophilia bacterium]